MCNPIAIPIATFIISAASTAASLEAQRQDAKAQEKYQKSLAEARNAEMQENADSALKSMADQLAAVNQELSQEQETAAQEIQDIQIERLQKAGTAMASSATGDIGMLMQDFYRQEAAYKESVRRNLDMSILQGGARKESIKATARDRINSGSPYIAKPIAQPDYLGGGLRIAGAALDSYSYYRQNSGKSG